jgi:hypothetical protein
MALLGEADIRPDIYVGLDFAGKGRKRPKTKMWVMVRASTYGSQGLSI